ncbi:MAG TPA: 2OG-Fe(II) oxygenase [Myxococcota bacterium]
MPRTSLPSGFDWGKLARELDERGHARLPGLLAPTECRELAALYGEARPFRKRVVMEQHRFGAGEYQYFGYPLPPLVRALRTALYAKLAPIANAWGARLGSRERYPASLTGFLARCREHAQTRPTPLLLHYRAGGYNRLHQDLYGAVAFPLQLTCLLSKPGSDFTGGEFLLLENRPRMQSRGEAIALEQGEAIVFPTRERPVSGPRGDSRAQMRHGVSVVRSGERTTLGIIFHDAQ